MLLFIMIQQWRLDIKQGAKEGGRKGKSPRAGIRIWDTRNTTALYVNALSQ